MSNKTITLESSEVKVEFYGTNAWLRNDGTSTIYAGRKPGVVSGADGVVSVPAGGSAPVFDAHGTVYIIGTGSVQLIGSDYSENPFKSSAQGGSGADEVARAAIEAHAGNADIHLTAEQLNTAVSEATEGGKTVEKASAYTLDNAVDYPLVDMRMFGKSTQDGVPSPENPVEIVSVESPTVTVCGKNLLNYNVWKDVTISNGTAVFENNGVTLTATKDDCFTSYLAEYFPESARIPIKDGETITLSWEETDNKLGNIFIFPNGKIDGCVNTGNATNKKISYTATAGISFITFCFGVTNNGDTISYKNIQIEKGSTATSYEPYIGSTASLTSALPLCGIPVTESGNYTDSNGQQWICDELIYNADGTGKIVKRVDTFTFDGSDDEQWNTNTTNTSDKWRLATSVKKDVIRPAKALNEVVPIICNSYLSNSSNSTFLNKDGIAVNTSGTIYIYNETCATYTLDEWKSYLASNPVTVVGVLNTPQEIQLTSEEMTALKALQTFDGVTNISNDNGAEMCVKYCTNSALSEYVKPIKTGLQKQIDELKTAVLSLGGNV